MCDNDGMQGFPKRRRKPGPSKNEEKVRRQDEAERRASIPLAAAFPRLERLTGELSFVLPPGSVLETKTIDAGREENLNLSFDCPGRCGRGRFHLGPKVAAAIAQNREVLQIADACTERSMGTDACGCEMRGTLNLRLTPLPE